MLETDGYGIFGRVVERSTPLDSLVGSIAEWIGLAIIEGRLQPGDDLISLDLSRQFHTSRTPIREALLLLEREGLVTILPHRRASVTRVSLSKALEISHAPATLLTPPPHPLSHTPPL